MNRNSKEIRPGHFVRIVDNKVVESVPKEEADYLKMVAHGSDVDSGIIQVALALAAILAVVTSISTSVIIKIMTNIAFLASTLSAVLLYGAYCEKKIPNILVGFFQTRFKKYPPLSVFWVLSYFFVALARYMRYWKQPPLQDHENIIELSYIILLYAMIIAAFSIEMFILIGISESLGMKLPW